MKEIVANEDDIEAGVELYEKIAESNELGLSPYIMSVYEEAIKPLLKKSEGTTRKEIQSRYYAVHQRFLSTQTLQKEILPSLELASVIRQEPDPSDKRRWLMLPPVETTNSLEKLDVTNSSLDSVPITSKPDTQESSAS